MNRIMTKSTITSTTGQQQQKQQHTYHIPTPPPPVPPIVPHRGSLVEIALENTSREAARLRTDLTNIRIQRDELLAQVTQLRSTANMSADERVAQADMRVAALESKLATALANFPSETIMLNTIEQLNDRLRLVTGELNHLREEMTQKEDLLKKVDLEQQLLRNEITSLTELKIAQEKRINELSAQVQVNSEKNEKNVDTTTTTTTTQNVEEIRIALTASEEKVVTLMDEIATLKTGNARGELNAAKAQALENTIRQMASATQAHASNLEAIASDYAARARSNIILTSCAEVAETCMSLRGALLDALAPADAYLQEASRLDMAISTVPDASATSTSSTAPTPQVLAATARTPAHTTTYEATVPHQTTIYNSNAMHFANTHESAEEQILRLRALVVDLQRALMISRQEAEKVNRVQDSARVNSILLGTVKDNTTNTPMRLQYTDGRPLEPSGSIFAHTTHASNASIEASMHMLRTLSGAHASRRY